MASLYEIDRDIQAFIDGLFAMADENGEVDIDMDILEDLKEQRQTKLENIALYIKNLASEASAIKEEENSLSERRKRLERKCERLKGILVRSMTENNEKEISSPRYCAKIRDSKATEIYDDKILPPEYIVGKTTYAPDKTAIKKAIEAGNEVAGARIVINHNLKLE
jgi:chromosome segregation ATPase